MARNTPDDAQSGEARPAQYLGGLERQILKVLRDRRSATARELTRSGRVKEHQTAVSSILLRLYRKQLVGRVAEGRAFRYSPVGLTRRARRRGSARLVQRLLASRQQSRVRLSELIQSTSDSQDQVILLRRTRNKTERQVLGPFERTLLAKLWERGSGTASELIHSQQPRRAYTTVMTTLGRMYEKGILRRKFEGKAFRYFPRSTKEEHLRASLETAARLLDSVTPLPLSFLVETVGQQGNEMLDELERIVEAKRAALEKCGPKLPSAPAHGSPRHLRRDLH